MHNHFEVPESEQRLSGTLAAANSLSAMVVAGRRPDQSCGLSGRKQRCRFRPGSSLRFGRDDKSR